jgi:two-component system, sensor histidine kinase
MHPDTRQPIHRVASLLVLNLSSAASYYATALISAGMTLIPEWFTPVWIPAGVVVLFSLLFGHKACPGLITGALVFHWHFHTGTGIEPSSVLAFTSAYSFVPGIAFQCILAKRLLRPVAIDPGFNPNRSMIAKLLLRSAAVATVVPVTVHLSGFLTGASDFLPATLLSLGKWWMGDFLGICSLLCIPILVLQYRIKPEYGRFMRHLSPMVIYLLALFIAYPLVERWEMKILRDRLENVTKETTASVNAALTNSLSKLEIIRLQYHHDRKIDPSTFYRQVEHIRSEIPGIQAINLMGLVRISEIAAVEQRLRHHYGKNFQFQHRVGEDLTPVTASFENPFIIPILLIAPVEGNAAVLGVDLSEFSASAIRPAIASGTPHMMHPFRLTQETAQQKGIAVYFPLEPADYDKLHLNYASLEYGLINVVFRLDDFIRSIWEPITEPGLSIETFDVTDTGQRELISKLNLSSSPSHSAVQEPGFLMSDAGRVQVCNRTWEVHIHANHEFVARHHSWTPILGLMAGLLSSFFIGVHCLGGFLRSRIIEEAVEQQTCELRESKETAERLAQTKMDFLAVMSHEIRTPMNGMISTAELLWESPLDEDQRELLSIIDLSSKTLFALVNDILDFSKIDAGKLTLESNPVDVRALVKAVEATFRAKAHEKHLKIMHSHHGSVPVGFQLMGDKNRLMQILVNLVSNAIKFTDQGVITITSKVEEATYQSCLLIFEVKDHGIGIDPQRIPEIFEPFSQIDSTSTRKFGGTGLGLAIVKRILDQMGGEIGCSSSVGTGSTFTVRVVLPIAPIYDLQSSSLRPDDVQSQSEPPPQ